MKIQNILALNVNSVLSGYRKQLLFNYVDTYRADIIFLSETGLKTESNLNLKGYNSVRQDRIKCNGGGTAIFLNEKIKYRNNNNKQ